MAVYQPMTLPTPKAKSSRFRQLLMAGLLVTTVVALGGSGAQRAVAVAPAVASSGDLTASERHRRVMRLVTEVVDRSQLWDRAQEIARAIAEKPTAATQGTVRAIWESLDKPYRAAVEQGLAYTRIGNPIGSAEVDRSTMAPTTPRIR